MNLKDSRQRRMLIAFGATAAVAAGGVTAGVVAASAASTLTVTPGTTSATILNVGAAAVASDVATQYNLDQDLSNVAFATRVTSTPTGPLKLVLDTAPTTSALLFYGQTLPSVATGPAPISTDTAGGGNGTPDTGSWLALKTLTPGTTDTSGALTATSNTYLTANVPGTYTFHYVDDMGTVDSSDDATSSTFTLTVKDVEANTVATTDDWAPVVSVPASAQAGMPITATLPLSGLTTSDARGSAAGTPHLASKLGVITGLRMTGAGTTENVATTSGQTVSAASITRTRSTSSAASDLVATAYVDVDGDATWTVGAGEAVAFGTPGTTDVVDNGVTGLVLAAASVTGSVLGSSASTDAVKVLTGTGTVSFTGTTTGGGAGDLVFFDLGGTDVASLTTNGTLVDPVAKIFSVPANASGVATLEVTSTVTTNAGTYTVDAASNGVDATTPAAGGSDILTVDYDDAVATTLEITNTTASLFPVVGSSVTITGRLLDQFSAVYVPSASQDKQVTITYGAAPTTAVVNTSAGAFSHTYTPTTTPTAGGTTSVSAASTLGGGITGTATITWAGAGDAADLDLAASDTTPDLAVATTTPAGNSTATITGTVKDSAGTALPYKSVTLTSTSGALFADATTPSATHPLSSSITVAANASGVYTAYAWFTKTGAVTLRATAGTFSETTDVTVNAAANTSDYIVDVDDVAGAPGDTLTVSGKVTDVWGNPVSGVTLTSLSSDNPSLGVLGTPGATNSTGAFSTTFTTGSNASGTATLTAAITAAAADPHALWATAGVTLAKPTVEATSTITVAEQTVALNVTATRQGSGKVTLSGTTVPKKVVKLYVKNKGTDDTFSFIGTVKAGNGGAFSKTVTIYRSKTFVASINADAVYSDEVSATVNSTVVISKVTAKGKRKVSVALDGNPDNRGTAVISVKVGNMWQKLATVSTDNKGKAYAVVTAPKRGLQVFQVTYTAPGTESGSATAQVQVL